MSITDKPFFPSNSSIKESSINRRGDSAHNQYFYGPNINSSGFNNFSYGFWFAFPEEADRFYPIIQIKHFEAISDFKISDYAKDRNEGWLFSFIATTGILE